MRVNGNSNLINLFPNQRLKSKQATKKTISSGIRDSYVHGTDYTSGVYSANSGSKRNKITSSVLDKINFNYLDIMKRKCDKQFSFVIGGKEYLKSELPAVSADRCEEIKAVNNTVDFSNGRYYKYAKFGRTDRSARMS